MDDEPSSLRLDTVTNADRVVILARGDIDAATAPQLSAVVSSVLDEASTIEFDLSEVGFFDSTALGVLADTIRSLEAVDGTLELRCVPASIMRLLRITDLLRFVTVISTSADPPGSART